MLPCLLKNMFARLRPCNTICERVGVRMAAYGGLQFLKMLWLPSESFSSVWVFVLYTLEDLSIVPLLLLLTF